MAEALLTLEEAGKELKLTKDQIGALVKSGALRGFRDQQTYKFRRADIDAYKKAAESSATVLYGAEKDKTDTSRIDLADIESEPGADESDQTSVLHPVEAGDAEKKEETPAFEFSEKELGLSLEDDSAEADESDQTSLMAPTEAEAEDKKEESPALAFEKKEKKPGKPAAPAKPGKPADESVLVADESESSIDILEVADESSSDTHSGESDLTLVDESGDDIPTVDIEDSDEKAPKKGKPAKAEKAKADTVADILSKGDEGTDEELETIDIDEVVDTQEAPLEPAAAGAETATVPLGDDVDTAGIAVGDSTQAVEGEEGAAAPVAALEEGMVEAEAAEEAEDAEGTPTLAPAGWEVVVPWKAGNALLVAALVILVFGGIFLMSEVASINEGDTGFLAWMVQHINGIVGKS